jgi:molybdopterin synthase sulfur carrier subunit|tara:strand:+ start:1047 stop:1298 length:252 start_codon:yes stop_codon:yes gene_type:complete
MMVKIMYFAWVREKIGASKEVIETNAGTVNELILELSQKGENYKIAFSKLDEIKVALDQDLADFNSSLLGVKEVAFFPPMTGG